MSIQRSTDLLRIIHRRRITEWRRHLRQRGKHVLSRSRPTSLTPMLHKRMSHLKCGHCSKVTWGKNSTAFCKLQDCPSISDLTWTKASRQFASHDPPRRCKSNKNATRASPCRQFQTTYTTDLHKTPRPIPERDISHHDNARHTMMMPKQCWHSCTSLGNEWIASAKSISSDFPLRCARTPHHFDNKMFPNCEFARTHRRFFPVHVRSSFHVKKKHQIFWVIYFKSSTWRKGHFSGALPLLFTPPFGDTSQPAGVWSL